MRVFVLLGGFDYEGESLLGVFDSREKAEAAELKAEGFDYLEVRECNLNELVGDED